MEVEMARKGSDDLVKRNGRVKQENRCKGKGTVETNQGCEIGVKKVEKYPATE